MLVLVIVKHTILQSKVHHPLPYPDCSCSWIGDFHFHTHCNFELVLILEIDGGKSAVVEEITVGSRNVSNITDATDPGGRLGPFLTPGVRFPTSLRQPSALATSRSPSETNLFLKGRPDLRNMDVWFQPVQEGDLIMLCSDGVHDNLDPQSQGLLPTKFGLESDDWTKVSFPPSPLVPSVKACIPTGRLSSSPF